MKITIPVYSEQELSPRAVEVIRAITNSAYPEHEISFCTFVYQAGRRKALVFGRAPDFPFKDMEYIYTYSVAQIMTKANAASALKAALRFFIDEPEPIPFDSIKVHINAINVLSYLDPTMPTAIDIETDGALGDTETPEEVNILSIAFYQAGQPPVVIMSGGVDDDGNHAPLHVSALRLLADVLPKFTKGIYHNGKFDTRVLNRVLNVKLVVWADTMLMHHVLNHGAGDHKLKTLARRYLGAPEWEVGLKEYLIKNAHYERIPPHKLKEYNAYDVYWTYKLWEFLEPQVTAEPDNERAYLLEMSASDFLLKVEKVGIPFDDVYAGSYTIQLELEQIRQLAIIRILIGREINPNSPKQVKEYLQGIGFESIKTTDVEALELCMDELSTDNPHKAVIEAIINYRKAGKIKGTYAGGWTKHYRNGRVHPTFLVQGTTTGRLSSANPNAQNMPRDKAIRRLVSL